MTEKKWLESTDPRAMLKQVMTVSPMVNPLGAPLGDRKLRLFAAAVWRTRPCCWIASPDLEKYLRVAGLAECLADGKPLPHDVPRVGSADYIPLIDDAHEAARFACSYTKGMRRPEAALLREIIGNPFSPVRLPPAPPVPCTVCDATGFSWGSEGTCLVCQGTTKVPGPSPWLTPTVVGLAGHAYDKKDFTGLPALADALEDAGCVGEVCGGTGFNAKDQHQPGSKYWECHRCQRTYIIAAGPGTGIPSCIARLPHPLLTHLRGPGPHVRGCWAVDLLLGRK